LTPLAYVVKTVMQSEFVYLFHHYMHLFSSSTSIIPIHWPTMGKYCKCHYGSNYHQVNLQTLRNHWNWYL